MIAHLIVDAAEIRKCQSRLEAELMNPERADPFWAHYETRGLPGGIDHEAYYLRDFDIYWKGGDSTGVNRYWNSFGVRKRKLLRDAFQVAIPKEGVNRRVQGAFVKSDDGIFIIHRGRLGGGRKDGRHDVRDITPEAVREFNDNGRVERGTVFRFLDDNTDFDSEFLPRIAETVKAVASSLGRV